MQLFVQLIAIFHHFESDLIKKNCRQMAKGSFREEKNPKIKIVENLHTAAATADKSTWSTREGEGANEREREIYLLFIFELTFVEELRNVTFWMWKREKISITFFTHFISARSVLHLVILYVYTSILPFSLPFFLVQRRAGRGKDCALHHHRELSKYFIIACYSSRV
jgi:hypothetical protein